jgi:hypothetical protein
MPYLLSFLKICVAQGVLENRWINLDQFDCDRLLLKNQE